MNSRAMTRILACFFFLLLSACASLSPQLTQRIQRAMMLSNQPSVQAAYTACDEWSQILDTPLPTQVQALSLSLYASCLVRIGQDDQAVSIYNKVLDLQPQNSDALAGKARSLQRLMKYREAGDCFRKAGNAEDEALCLLRMGDMRTAFDVLCIAEQTPKVTTMRMTLALLMDPEHQFEPKDTELLSEASDKDPFLAWVAACFRIADDTSKQTFSLLQILSININAFDDPLLSQLDDKVHLHNLLKGKSFWPEGYVLPDGLPNVPRELKSWMLKARNGYGSHGNRIVTTEWISTIKSKESQVLLQDLVHPPLLIDGRKFSMRVYVVCFLDGSVYLCEDGLLKFAAEDYDESFQYLEATQMTNSGRTDGSDQKGFAYLKDKLKASTVSFDAVWKQVESSVQEVFESYEKLIEVSDMSTYRMSLERLGIPKILGLDFLLDRSGKAWLIEVNRFPGLEARDDSDRAMKHLVLQLAWNLAAKRQKLALPWAWPQEEQYNKWGKIKQIL